MNTRRAISLVLAFCLSLACSSVTIVTESTPVTSVTDSTQVPTLPPISIPTLIPSDPVSIREGLASLNSYSLVIESNSSGPSQTEYSHTRIEIQKSKDQDATSTHYVVDQVSAGESEPTKTDSYVYSIGNAQCAGSDADEWTYTPLTPQQKEMQDLFSEMMDILPLIDNPTYVGSETMNGIMANHFAFQVSGLGLQSSAEVTANQGDYWLAQDGQYIVKYILVTETVDTTSQAKVRMDVLIELTGVNQPVTIAFPVGCAP